ncbi:hypothetical protein KIL84_022847 [Mauremys mutica]|uniref:Uncharacterized protein n=1 Tax=Mauremys mutica TaxID=74926 RepID=A0A9D3WRJ6_9SAUR|nr:hypothetical protein KIL84_022847 [Mauremys mutica]
MELNVYLTGSEFGRIHTGTLRITAMCYSAYCTRMIALLTIRRDPGLIITQSPVGEMDTYHLHWLSCPKVHNIWDSAWNNFKETITCGPEGSSSSNITKPS